MEVEIGVINPFEDFLTSEIRLIKPNGNVLGPFKASVQSREILIFEVQHPVTAGDKSFGSCRTA